jgi:hypothetical protein
LISDNRNITIAESSKKNLKFTSSMSELNLYIKTELKKRKKHYKESPALLVQDYHIEQQNIQAYNGRQLLEMLQNADDAAEIAKDKKVAIRLADNYLHISNNGEPFTEEGFQSIIYSNISSKTIQQNKIGNKGLGFRSILSWSDEVIIQSGGATIAFSEPIATSFLKELINEQPSLKGFIARNSKVEFPIATLRVPQVIKNDLAKQEFDTSISIKLKEDIFEDVQQQILSIIDKETLIFLNHLEIVEIDSPEKKIIYKKYVQGNSVTIVSEDFITGNTSEKTWHILKREGRHKDKNYELAIAWNDLLDDNQNALFSYFKTRVRFPFPALLHGTFELTSDRNQLSTDIDGHNEFLTSKLTDLLIEVAEKIARSNTPSNFEALRLLHIDFNNVDPLLIQFSFREKIIEKIKASNLFPNNNGNYINHSQKPVYYHDTVFQNFSGKDVANLMPYCNDENLRNYISSFGLFHYTLPTLFSIISKRLSNLDHSSLANVLYFLINQQSYKNEILSEQFDLKSLSPILIDQENNVIPWDAEIFFHPNSNIVFKLPKAIKVRFLSTDLVNHLCNFFKVENSDFLLNQLRAFGIRRYSFTEIANTLASHYSNTNVTVAEARQLHQYLFSLFSNEIKANGNSNLKENLTTVLPTANNKIKKSNSLYFGTIYNNPLADLLYSFDKSKIVADPQGIGFKKANIETVKIYLQWLGVAELPRYELVALDRSSSEYHLFQEYFLRNFDYKKSIDTYYNDRFRDYNHLNSELRSVTKIQVGHFDDLKRILQKVKPETIFLWIKSDDRLKKTLEENTELLSDASARLDLKGKVNLREIRKSGLKSYTRWLLSNSAWMPVESEAKKATPNMCCLAKTITSDFSPFVEKPKLNIAAIADKLDVSEDVIENYVVLSGVHREIASFSIETLYNILLSLSSLNKEEKIAKSIYREIINNFNENKLDTSHPAYLKFINNGSIFCQKGTQLGYFPVKDAYYIDTKTLGNNILKRFPIAAIDRKKGNKKVERIFGVKPLENVSFRINDEPIEHSLNHTFTEEISRFKGLVYSLRIHNDTDHSIKNRLKRMTIHLVESISAQFIHGNSIETFELEPFEFINNKNKTKLHVLVPKEYSELSALRDNVAFCESISEIFTNLIGTEEYREFIHDLYSKREIDRERRMISFLQLDTNEVIVQAKQDLDIVDDLRLSFWRAFFVASPFKLKAEIKNEQGLNETLLKKLKAPQEKILLYVNFNPETFEANIEALESLYELFISHRIDYNMFGRHFSGMDFSNLFKYKIADLKNKYASTFAAEIYKMLLPRATEEKSTFFEFIDNYDNLEYGSEDGFLCNIEEYFKKKLKDDFQITTNAIDDKFSYRDVIGYNIEQLKQTGVIIPENILSRKDVQSLLLFNEKDEVSKIIQSTRANTPAPKNDGNIVVNVRGVDIEYKNYEELATLVIQSLDFNRFKIRPGKTVPIEEHSNDGKSRRKNNKRNVVFSTKNEEQIGFIAELYSYQMLCKKFHEANVNWVSENAFRAFPTKFISSEAGKGYDFEVTENNKVRYIEVKGTKRVESGIIMSNEEMRVALEYSEKYDLLIVENPLGEPSFRHIRTPFKFKRTDSLFSNDKLKVFNENYVIKFAWDDL